MNTQKIKTLAAMLNPISGDMEFFAARAYLSLRKSCEKISDDDLIEIAAKIAYSAGSQPLLEDEKIDAARELLENGLNPDSIDAWYPHLAPEQMLEFMKTCDDDIFGRLIDEQALVNRVTCVNDDKHEETDPDLMDALVAAQIAGNVQCMVSGW